MVETIFDISIFTQTIITFSKLLEEENHLLKNMKISSIEHLREEKERLSNIVVQFDMIVKKMPEILINQKREDLDLLSAQYKIFMSLAEENFKLVEKAAIANRGIVEYIKKQIIKDIEAKQNYGKKKSKNKKEIPPITIKENI